MNIAFVLETVFLLPELKRQMDLGIITLPLRLNDIENRLLLGASQKFN